MFRMVCCKCWGSKSETHLYLFTNLDIQKVIYISEWLNPEVTYYISLRLTYRNFVIWFTNMNIWMIKDKTSISHQILLFRLYCSHVVVRCIADWWYAVIGHLDSCNHNSCQCHYNGNKISHSIFSLQKHLITFKAFNNFKLNIDYSF